MPKHKIAFITSEDRDTALVEQGLVGLDYELVVAVCRNDGEVIEAAKGADVIINFSVPMPKAVMDEIDTARAIVSVGHGFNHIDHNAATDNRLMLVNCAGYVTEEVSNHIIMLLLACSRKLRALDSMVRAGKWSSATRDLAKSIPDIDGQILGIVGLGNIGRATARKAAVFGLKVMAYDPYCRPWDAREYKVEMVPSLDILAARSDYVSLLVPLNDETRKLIGKGFFEAMKPTAYLINTARGPIVDEAALIEALETGQIAGAGIDVFEQEPTPPDNPLLSMDNVIVTPHTAGVSEVARAAGMVRVGEETARILGGVWPMSLVNPHAQPKVPMRHPGFA